MRDTERVSETQFAEKTCLPKMCAKIARLTDHVALWPLIGNDTFQIVFCLKYSLRTVSANQERPGQGIGQDMCIIFARSL